MSSVTTGTGKNASVEFIVNMQRRQYRKNRLTINARNCLNPCRHGALVIIITYQPYDCIPKQNLELVIPTCLICGFLFKSNSSRSSHKVGVGEGGTETRMIQPTSAVVFSGSILIVSGGMTAWISY